MIPKSGNRFSDKIMLKQDVRANSDSIQSDTALGMPTIRVAVGVLIALLLAGCAGGLFGDSTPAAATPTADMAGRWILTAPNAPSCGMNFGGAPGVQQGTVAPEGGCPGKFFTSRHWTIEQGALTINDQENQPLAHLAFAGDRFEGQATAGMAVTLSR
jgi:hypothetical protein